MIISSITPTQQMKTTKKYAKKPYMMVEGDCFNTVPEREQDLVVVDKSVYSAIGRVSEEASAVLNSS